MRTTSGRLLLMSIDPHKKTWKAWQKYCDTPYLQRPDIKTRDQLAAMEPSELSSYNAKRNRYHSFMAPVQTSLMREVHDIVELVRSTNPVGGYAARNAVVIDGAPTVGKTTAITHFARTVDRRSRQSNGDRTDSGAYRIPTVLIGLSGNPSMKDMSQSIATFLGVPEAKRTAERWTADALKTLAEAETEFLIVDDLHCINAGNKNGQARTDHLKRLLDDFAVTCVYAGVDLNDKGLYDTTGRRTAGRMDQTARRWTLVRGERISAADKSGQAEWKQLVATLESQLALCAHPPGQLVDSWDLLYERTTGSVGTLVELLKRAAFLAMRNGAEQIDEQLINRTPLPVGADAARRATAAELRAFRGQGRKGKSHAR